MDDTTTVAAWHEVALPHRTTVIALHGHVDYLDAVALKHRLADLAAAGTSELIVDLSRALTVERAVLPALVVAQRRMATRRARLAVVATQPDIRAMLEDAGARHVIQIAATLDDALEARRA